MSDNDNAVVTPPMVEDAPASPPPPTVRGEAPQPSPENASSPKNEKRRKKTVLIVVIAIAVVVVLLAAIGVSQCAFFATPEQHARQLLIGKWEGYGTSVNGETSAVTPNSMTVEFSNDGFKLNLKDSKGVTSYSGGKDDWNVRETGEDIDDISYTIDLEGKFFNGQLHFDETEEEMYLFMSSIDDSLIMVFKRA